jgi:histone deacetylase 1/2
MHASINRYSPVPFSARAVLKDPNWLEAMTKEYRALLSNDTWDLVPPRNANIVSGKWVFRQKLKPDSFLDRYKARWVLRGFSQEQGVNFNETFSPIVKPTMVRVIFSNALSLKWETRQLDVKNAFLHGKLTEVIYSRQPIGFINSTRPEHICRLNRSLYGLKQAPRAWYQCFTTFITSIGFTFSHSDTSLFVLQCTEDTTFLLLYIDDIVLTASSTQLLDRITTSLHSEFAMMDMGSLHYFLGIAVTRDSSGMHLSQAKYAAEILDNAGMTACKSAMTPVDTSPNLSASAGPPVADPTEYRSLAVALQYLTFTRPDIAYAVQQVCFHMHDPREQHLVAIKHILRYVKGTLSHGLHLHSSSPASMVTYMDANWAGCPDTRRFTSGFCIYLGDNLISWSSKRQHTVSRSSAEAEYRVVANAVAEASWIRQLLHELHRPSPSATVVFCNNVSAIYMSTDPVQHQRTKHIEIDLHFVRDHVSMGQVRVLHVPSSRQFTDILTKGLPSPLCLDFRSSLNVCTPPVATAGEY